VQALQSPVILFYFIANGPSWPTPWTKVAVCLLWVITDVLHVVVYRFKVRNNRINGEIVVSAVCRSYGVMTMLFDFVPARITSFCFGVLLRYRQQVDDVACWSECQVVHHDGDKCKINSCLTLGIRRASLLSRIAWSGLRPDRLTNVLNHSITVHYHSTR